MFKITLLISICAILTFTVSGCATNPVTGETQLQLFGSDYEQDIRMGQQAAPEVEKEFNGPIKNPTLQNYINSVGQRIARVSHAPNMQFHYEALDHKSVNAFALPGGYIYITRGMLEKLKTEAQLAGILGHETAHVTARHSTVRMSQQIGMDILFSTVTSDKTPAAAVQAASLGVQVAGLKFSRDDEREADSIGMDYMVKAGYNPYGMVETMEMLAEEDAAAPVEFLSTHPSPENRKETLTEMIQSKYMVSGLRVGADDYSEYVLRQLGK